MNTHWHRLLSLFFFGLLAASFALVLEVALFDGFFFSPKTLMSVFLLTAFGVAILEEGSKALFLRQYAFRFLSREHHQEDASFATSILFGAFFGLGFAAVEAAFLLWIFPSIFTLFFLGTVALHLLTSIILVRYYLKTPLPRFRPSLPFISLAIFLHLLYNAAVFYSA